MGLRSTLFRGDTALDACLIRDSAHLTVGTTGEHVSKVQQAVLTVGQSGIRDGELAALRYGESTAAAVLKYKQSHKPPIINRTYQTVADNIVGKMTIAALDDDLAARPPNDPLTNPGESARIQALIDRERFGALLMVQTTIEALKKVQTAFNLADTDPNAAAGLLFTERFAIDGLNRFFAVTQNNHRSTLPKVIENFERYLLKFPNLSFDQAPADYGFLLHHALFRGEDGKLFLKDGRITADTPVAFSSPNHPRLMLFTPRYRNFDPAMPPLFRGLFREALRGIQIHEMGHFYFGFIDGSPAGKSAAECLRLAVSYDVLARQITFRHLVH
jgi:hypothetical protein